MKDRFNDHICKVLKAEKLNFVEEVQSLWSGYGSIKRYSVEGGEVNSIIVKYVDPPNEKNHPRGWNTNVSHKRKIKSYEVEVAWYDQWSKLCDHNCAVPQCLTVDSDGEEVLMVLEDLDEKGFPSRLSDMTWDTMKTCLSWFAYFHGRFLGEGSDGLWDIGTYWHLDTRADELAALDESSLKSCASSIDKALSNSQYQTIVHGDGKLANFCFSTDGKSAAAVDFQYVGGGCGMKDIAYFVGSCLREEECEKMEEKILDYYFEKLNDAFILYKKPFRSSDIEKEWRPLYRVAWADFHRFLKGWSPGHWKINSYSERVTQEVVTLLKGVDDDSK